MLEMPLVSDTSLAVTSFAWLWYACSLPIKRDEIHVYYTEASARVLCYWWKARMKDAWGLTGTVGGNWIALCLPALIQLAQSKSGWKMCEVSSQGMLSFLFLPKISVGENVPLSSLCLSSLEERCWLWTFFFHCSQNPILTLAFSKHKMCNGCIRKNKHVVLKSKGIGCIFIVCFTCDRSFQSWSAGH